MTKSLPRRRSNPTLEIIFKDYPKYSAWGFLALEWFKTLRLITNLHIRGVAYFIIDYLVKHKISGDPSVFLSIDFNAPNSVTLGLPDTPTGRNVSNQLCAFLDFVLTKTHDIGGIVHNYTNPNCFRNPVSRRVITSGKSKFKYTVMPGLTTKSNDIQFIWLQEVADERIIQWRRYAISYMKFQKRSVAARLNALSKFFQYYLINMNIFVNPEEFLLRSNTFPDFYNHCCLNLKSGKKITMIVNDFINHVLIEGFSVPDDYNRPVIPYEYHNPIAIPDVKYYEQPFESVRSTLAYGYIEEIRSMIAEGPNFSDWKFAHSATGRRDFVNCPDWFVVDKKLIDENDPDCVWRHRRPIGRVEEIYEMWSPVSWVALLLKTILPLRSMQIRMLDSGEADTFRYENGEWHLNTGKLASGRPGKSHNNGVLRRKVAEDGSVITMLFANTNKTADAEKTGDKKGFEFPWVKFTGVEGDPFYWIEKLRNWQQKYNPISRPANWDEMDGRRIQAKSKYQISMYSPTCFLFRMPEPHYRQTYRREH